MGQCGSAEGERSRNVQDTRHLLVLVRSLHLRAFLAETCVEALSCQSKAPKRGTPFYPSSVRLARKTSLAEFSLPRLRIEAMGTGTSVDAELGFLVFIFLHRVISSYIWLYITVICNSYICIHIYIYTHISISRGCWVSLTALAIKLGFGHRASKGNHEACRCWKNRVRGCPSAKLGQGWSIVSFCSANGVSENQGTLFWGPLQ